MAIYLATAERAAFLGHSGSAPRRRIDLGAKLGATVVTGYDVGMWRG